jgi:multicomponent Na+:H+ antiporter subunit B
MSLSVRRAMFVVAGAGLLALVAWGLIGLPAFGHYRGPYGIVINHRAVPDRHATNAVSAVNFDYRGFDTVGEEFILFVAVMAVAMLLRTERRERRHEPSGRAAERALPDTSDVVRLAGIALICPAIVVGLNLVTHGQSTPGGGFQGGLVLASAPVLLFLIGRYLVFRRLNPVGMLDLGEGSGAGGFVVVGFVGMIVGTAFLENVLPLGQPGSVFSAGTLPLISLSVGLEVASGIVLVVFEFLEQTLAVRSR